jgi:hypothetical protein
MTQAVTEKTHALLSPSGAHRWANCPGSVVLEEGEPNTGSKYARWGTCAHEVAGLILETAVKANVWEPENAEGYIGRVFQIEGHDVEFDHEMADCVNDYVAHVESYWEPGDTLIAEQAVPLSHLTGEEGAEGTSDCIILKARTREIVVIDLKAGKGEMVDADENLQGVGYGSGSIEKHDLFYGPFERVTVVIIQPRLQHVSEWSVDMAEFQTWEQKWRDGAAAVRDAQADAKTGLLVQLNPDRKTCRWCKAKHKCSALAGEVTEGLRKTAPPAAADDFPDLSLPKQAAKAAGAVDEAEAGKLAEAYRALPLIEQWVEAVKSRVMAMLLAEQDVPGFTLYEGRRGARKWSSAAKVETTLKAARLKVDEMYTKTLASPTALEKLLKEKPKVWAKVAGFIEQGEAGPQIGPAGDAKKTPFVRVKADDFPDLAEVDPFS